MSEPIQLHRQIRQAHAIAAQALAAVGRHYHDQPGQVAIVERLHTLHTLMERTEQMLSDELDSQIATEIHQVEQMTKERIPLDAIARILGYQTVEALQQMLAANKRRDLAGA